MGYGKKNTIKIDPLSYNIGLIGESGIGKTTIIKEMCEKLVGEDGYRFLECGKEDGADGINGINYLNCPEWSMDYDEETNSINASGMFAYPLSFSFFKGQIECILAPYTYRCDGYSD